MTKVNKSTKKTQPTKPTAVEVTAPVTEKTCPKCDRTLPLGNFPHDYRRKDTLYIYCRECEAKRQYAKHTRKILNNAEQYGYVAGKVTHKIEKAEIDVLKITSDPITGKTTLTELAQTV